MSDTKDLWSRIDEARRRLGVADQAQIKQVEDLNERIKAVKAGLSTRYRELESHRDEVSKLRRENEHLRHMMHRLLLAIEERYGGRLKDILQDLEKQVSFLVSLAADPVGAAAPAPGPESGTPGQADEAKAAPDDPANDPPAPGAAEDRAGAAPDGGEYAASAAVADPPSETDSRWLHEIMERARELTGERAGANKVAALDPPSRSAVA